MQFGKICRNTFGFRSLKIPKHKLMLNKVAYISISLLLSAVAMPALAQEILTPAKILAKGSRKHPSLGLPLRLDGTADPVVWYDAGTWHGADSLKAEPFWNMAQVPDVRNDGRLAPILDFCEIWASEKPKGAVDVVYGLFRGGWYFAVCKKIKGYLGWKSIAFVVPEDGIPDGKQAWDYSLSVNLLEYLTGYNLFPELPRHLQELVEEMTACEHLCPFQEYDQSPLDDPDREIDFDWEDDFRDRM